MFTHLHTFTQKNVQRKHIRLCSPKVNTPQVLKVPPPLGFHGSDSRQRCVGSLTSAFFLLTVALSVLSLIFFALLRCLFPHCALCSCVHCNVVCSVAWPFQLSHYLLSHAVCGTHPLYQFLSHSIRHHWQTLGNISDRDTSTLHFNQSDPGSGSVFAPLGFHLRSFSCSQASLSIPKPTYQCPSHTPSSSCAVYWSSAVIWHAMIKNNSQRRSTCTIPSPHPSP